MAAGSIAGSFIGATLLGIVPADVLLPALACYSAALRHEGLAAYLIEHRNQLNNSSQVHVLARFQPLATILGEAQRVQAPEMMSQTPAQPHRRCQPRRP